ncbi:hypothetical protein GLOIN_2v1719392 [Rhizophagus clarus]|uniref:Uncharacterized protein n=1 Tax=Rhizophagus clarus TaxID=94130 RepID=A0A8H3LGY6_9GLOM|nr:hypothetical protein GLOIN_2v1719392 [Rhizophagus clarus]
MSSKKEKKQKKQKNVGSESHPKGTTKNVESKSESSLAKITQKVPKKRKNENESESESFLGETAQETSQKQATQIASQKRKKFESESESSSAPKRRSKRIASQESDLASALRDLGFSSSYGMEDLPSSASLFETKDMEALRVDFCEAPAENAVIPDVEVTIPDTYIQPNINGEMLSNLRFRVANVAGLTDVKVRTFFKKLHKVVTNGVQLTGTTEKFTDTLVDDLLRIAELNDWPFSISNHPLCKLYIEDDPYVSSDPEFVINMEDDNMEDFSILVVEDKHLKNVGPSTGFGETQISAKVLACVSENIRSLGKRKYTNQILWVVRVISTYVTFYKAEIPARYLMELDKGLPQQQSVKIQRWPANNDLRAGFDLAEPNGRRSVLTALAKIRSSLLRENAD